MSDRPDILLVNPPPWLVDSPPLGLASLAAYAERQGFRVEVLDLNIELHHKVPESRRYLFDMNEHTRWERSANFPETWDLFRNQFEEAIDRIAWSEAPCIGFSVASPKQLTTIELIKGLVRRGVRKKILIGGPATETEPERHIFTNRIPYDVDGYVVGEGEEALVEILGRYRAGEGLDGIPGVCRWQPHYRSFTDLIPRKSGKPMHELSRPSYKNFPMHLYTTDCLVVEFSRSCVSDCGFCQVRAQWGTFRVKKPEEMYDEMVELAKQHGTGNFTFADPAVNGHRRQFLKLCDLLAKSEVDFRWSGLLLALRVMNPEDFKRMAAAGCHRLEVGVESGSPKVLKLMKKTATIESTELCLRSIKDAGMQAVCFLLTGYPGEEEEDFQQTLEFVTRNRSSIDMVRSVNALYLQEGTPVELTSESLGIIRPTNRPETWNTEWRIGDTNTLEIRTGRANRLINHLHSLGIDYELTSLDETGGKQPQAAC